MVPPSDYNENFHLPLRTRTRAFQVLPGVFIALAIRGHIVVAGQRSGGSEKIDDVPPACFRDDVAVLVILPRRSV